MLRYGKGTLLTTVMAGLLALSLLTAGCGSTTPTKSAAVSVKAMKVLQQDTAVSHDYSGQIKSTNAVTTARSASERLPTVKPKVRP